MTAHYHSSLVYYAYSYVVKVCLLFFSLFITSQFFILSIHFDFKRFPITLSSPPSPSSNTSCVFSNLFLFDPLIFHMRLIHFKQHSLGLYIYHLIVFTVITSFILLDDLIYLLLCAFVPNNTTFQRYLTLLSKFAVPRVLHFMLVCYHDNFHFNFIRGCFVSQSTL